MVNATQTLQILFVHFVYLSYSALLWYRLWMVAEEISFDINGTISVAAVWSTVYLVLNVFLIISGLKKIKCNVHSDSLE